MASRAALADSTVYWTGGPSSRRAKVGTARSIAPTATPVTCQSLQEEEGSRNEKEDDGERGSWQFGVAGGRAADRIPRLERMERGAMGRPTFTAFREHLQVQVLIAVWGTVRHMARCSMQREQGGASGGRVSAAEALVSAAPPLELFRSSNHR